MLDAVDATAMLAARDVDVTLDVVGAVFPGYESVETELHRRAAEAGITDRVRLHGYSDDVWAHLAACDISLVPSRLEESFGNTAVEGVLARRPVVVSSIGGLLEASDGFSSVVLVHPGLADGDRRCGREGGRRLVGDVDARRRRR